MQSVHTHYSKCRDPSSFPGSTRTCLSLPSPPLCCRQVSPFSFGTLPGEGGKGCLCSFHVEMALSSSPTDKTDLEELSFQSEIQHLSARRLPLLHTKCPGAPPSAGFSEVPGCVQPQSQRNCVFRSGETLTSLCTMLPQSAAGL